MYGKSKGSIDARTASELPRPPGAIHWAARIAQVGCIILGRGEDEKKVIEWLNVGASVPGFIGFAVGRSTFLEPIISLRAGRITRNLAVAEIARKFREWVDAFEQARRGG